MIRRTRLIVTFIRTLPVLFRIVYFSSNIIRVFGSRSVILVCAARTARVRGGGGGEERAGLGDLGLGYEMVLKKF